MNFSEMRIVSNATITRHPILVKVYSSLSASGCKDRRCLIPLKLCCIILKQNSYQTTLRLSMCPYTVASS